jgi:hypothetical protein
MVHDPMFTDEELAGYGWEPYHLGQSADAVIIQADHVEYTETSLDWFPGARALLDGRHLLESGRPGELQIGRGRGVRTHEQ